MRALLSKPYAVQSDLKLEPPCLANTPRVTPLRSWLSPRRASGGRSWSSRRTRPLPCSQRLLACARLRLPRGPRQGLSSGGSRLGFRLPGFCSGWCRDGCRCFQRLLAGVQERGCGARRARWLAARPPVCSSAAFVFPLVAVNVPCTRLQDNRGTSSVQQIAGVWGAGILQAAKAAYRLHAWYRAVEGAWLVGMAARHTAWGSLWCSSKPHGA